MLQSGGERRKRNGGRREGCLFPGHYVLEITGGPNLPKTDGIEKQFICSFDRKFWVRDLVAHYLKNSVELFFSIARE